MSGRPRCDSCMDLKQLTARPIIFTVRIKHLRNLYFYRIETLHGKSEFETLQISKFRGRYNF